MIKSAVAGETSTQAAKRELFEEIGLAADFADVRPVCTMHFSHGFDDYYLLTRTDVDPLRLPLQYEEVQAIRWADQAEILELLDAGVFVPYQKDLIRLLFSLRCFGADGALTGSNG